MDAGARAAILERAADLICRGAIRDLRRWRFSKSGKTWAEADADVAEAIDFCRYYAGEMRRIALNDLPGAGRAEHPSLHGAGRSRLIIAPWNFPLAILCGMTAAALVAGNCAIMKPSEQSAVHRREAGAAVSRGGRAAPGRSSYCAGARGRRGRLPGGASAMWR